MLETADIDTSNNKWNNDGTNSSTSKFQVFKEKQEGSARGAATGRLNPMQAAGKK